MNSNMSVLAAAGAVTSVVLVVTALIVVGSVVESLIEAQTLADLE